MPGAQVHEDGAQDAQVVEPFVLVKAGVLGGEDRELHVGRERRDGHHGAPLREQLGEERPVARHDARDLGRVVVPAELGHAREIALEVVNHEDERDEPDAGQDGGDQGHPAPIEPHVGEHPLPPRPLVPRTGARAGARA